MLVQIIIFLSVALIIVSVLALILIDRTALYMRNEFLNDREKSLFKLLIEAFPDMFVFSHVSTLAILEPKKGLKRKEYKRIYNTLSKHFFLFTLFTKDEDMRFVCSVEFANNDDSTTNSKTYKDLQAIFKRNKIITLQVSTIELPNKLALRQQLNEKLSFIGHEMLPDLKDVLTEQIKQRTMEKGGLNDLTLDPSLVNTKTINDGVPVFDAPKNPSFHKHKVSDDPFVPLGAEQTLSAVEEQELIEEPLNLTAMQSNMNYEHVINNLNLNNDEKSINPKAEIKQKTIKPAIEKERQEELLLTEPTIQSFQSNQKESNTSILDTNLERKEKAFSSLSEEEEMRILGTKGIAEAEELIQDKLEAEEKRKAEEKSKGNKKIIDPIAGLDERLDSDGKKVGSRVNNANDLFYDLN